jgi:LysR family transcriptional regulator, transcriptional activator of nhaA
LSDVEKLDILHAVEWLNYHHLLYFWVVAKRGSVTAASKVLRLAHPTISGQIHQLEQVLGVKLFDRKGRGLVLTDTGRIAFHYADEIFTLGQELQDTLKGRSAGRQIRLVVGVSDVLAKSIVHRILEPAFQLQDKVRVICREERNMDALLVELAAHTVDVILSDTPAGPSTSVRTFSHPLGECASSFYAEPKLARSCRRGFPRSLERVPLLVPSGDSTFRRALNEWFNSHAIEPNIVAELDDLALASVLGEAGLGVFAAPDVITKELARRYNVELVGRATKLQHRFYAISIERKIKHPGVAAICQVARKHIFAGEVR